MDHDQGPLQHRLDLAGNPGVRPRVEIHHPDAPDVAIFSSGLGLPLDLWRPVVALIPDVRCVLVDRPAELASTRWSQLADLHDEVSLLAEALRAEVGPQARAVAVGHSMGGLFAEGLARLHPDAVRGLVLIDPADPAHEETRLQLEGWPGRWATSLAGYPWWAGLASRITAEVMLSAGTVHPVTGRARHDLVASYAEPGQLPATLAALGRVRADARELRELARSHPLPPVPVHLVVATYEAWPVRHRRRRWMRRMQRRAAQLGPGTVRTDVDAAHLVMLDAPVEVAGAVQACLG